MNIPIILFIFIHCNDLKEKLLVAWTIQKLGQEADEECRLVTAKTHVASVWPLGEFALNSVLTDFYISEVRA